MFALSASLSAASFLLFLFSTTTHATTPAQWRGRRIYQVMTDRYALANGSTTAWCDTAVGKYCGGTWKGVEGHLDYIQNMGFDAIWISPHTSQLPQYTNDYSSYHGYWQQNIYEINDKFGSEDDLHDLVNAVHARGMYIMFDIVTNHMAWSGDAPSIQYDRLIPFSNSSFYHLPYCPVNATTSQTNCWLGDSVVTLPDLRTEDTSVSSIFNSWISTVVSKYNIDGLRLDSAGNVNKDFFTDFCAAAGVFCLGEVYSGDPKYACAYQEVVDGVMNYPTFFPITRALQADNGSFDDVVDMLGKIHGGCKDTSLMGVFTENHDQPRFASYTDDMNLAKNIITYTLMSDGIPIIYQGQEQHLSGASNPFNREALWLTKFDTSAPLYNLTSALNIFRSHAISDSTSYLTTPIEILANTSHVVALRKDRVLTVLNNFGAGSKPQGFSVPLANTTSTPDTALLDVISCTLHHASSDGTLSLSITNGLPMVFYEQAALKGSAVCNGGEEGGVTTNPNIVAMDPPPVKSGAGSWERKNEWLVKVVGVVGAVMVGGLV